MVSQPTIHIFKFLKTAVHGLEYQIFESLWLNKSSVLTFQELVKTRHQCIMTNLVLWMGPFFPLFFGPFSGSSSSCMLATRQFMICQLAQLHWPSNHHCYLVFFQRYSRALYFSFLEVLQSKHGIWSLGENWIPNFPATSNSAKLCELLDIRMLNLIVTAGEAERVCPVFLSLSGPEFNF